YLRGRRLRGRRAETRVHLFGHLAVVGCERRGVELSLLVILSEPGAVQPLRSLLVHADARLMLLVLSLRVGRLFFIFLGDRFVVGSGFCGCEHLVETRFVRESGTRIDRRDHHQQDARLEDRFSSQVTTATARMKGRPGLTAIRRSYGWL